MPDAAPEKVAKADDPGVEVADLVPANTGGNTAESVPGSPDWEQMDAETAGNVISVLARVKGALTWLAGREATEQVNGSSDGLADMEATWDLEDSAEQIDWIISRLAGYAAREEIGADMADEMADVGKQAAGLVGPLAVVEQWAPIRKAGKVLSAANETAIRNAVDSLQNVLSSLPAPSTDTVAKAGKENTVETTDTTTAPAEETVEKEQTPIETPAETAPVAKADGDSAEKPAQVLVYDKDGTVVGIVDPADVSPIADAQAPGGNTPAAEPAAPAAPDLTPAPAAAAGAPVAKEAAADTTEPAGTTLSPDEVLKQALAPALEAALKDHPVVKALQDEVAHLKAPAPSKVVTNGQTPPARLLRGQNNTLAAADVDVAKADELRERLSTATTVQEQEQIRKEMQGNASAALTALQAATRAAHTR